MELFSKKGISSAKPAAPMRIVKSKLNKTRNTIKKQKNYLNDLYNDITSSLLRPTDETYEKAAFFNHVRDGYEFMAGPYRRQVFPSNAQIQGRLNYIKTKDGQTRLAELEADTPVTPVNIAGSTASRMSRIGKKQLLNRIRNLEFQEINNIGAELEAMPTGGAGFEEMPTGGGAGVSPGINPGISPSVSTSSSPSLSRSNSGNSTYSTENMVVVGSNPDAKRGGRRNCTYKKLHRLRSRRKTHRKRRN